MKNEERQFRLQIFKLRFILSFFIFLVGAQAGATIVASDSLFLKDGSVIAGNIIKVTETSVSINTPVGEINYRNEVIQRIFYETGMEPVVPLTPKEIKSKNIRSIGKRRTNITPYMGIFAPGSNLNYTDAVSFAGEVQTRLIGLVSGNLFGSYSPSSISDSLGVGSGITILEASIRFTQYGFDVLPYAQIGAGMMILNQPAGKSESFFCFSIGVGMTVLISKNSGVSVQYRVTNSRVSETVSNTSGISEAKKVLNTANGLYIGFTFFLE